MIRIARSFLVVLVALAFTGAVTAAEHDAKVDLNKASAQELIKLPRVGPAVAQRILDYRKQNGGFRTTEDLMHVRGIGKKSFDVLKDKVTVSESGHEREPKPGNSKDRDTAGK